MGYGLPAAVGVQMAHPKSLVIDIAGDASVQMTMQEMSTAVQYRLPIKIFILNNQYMGMVRQWQQLLHGNRLSESYSEALPDFVKLAEAYGCVGMRGEKPGELDDAIKEMIAVTPHPVIFDCRVASLANCFPMIPSGKAHNEMLLGEDVPDEEVGKRHRRQGQGAGVRRNAMNAHLHIQPARPISSTTAKLVVETHTLAVDRRQRAGRPRPRHRPVLGPRLQHRLAHRLGDRARDACLAHHHRDHRHARCHRADQAPARAHGAGAFGRRSHGHGQFAHPRTGAW